MQKEFCLFRQTWVNHFSRFFLLILILLPVIMNAQQTALKSFKDLNGKYGYKNESGKIIIEAKYDRVFEFNEGLAIVSLDKKFGTNRNLLTHTSGPRRWEGGIF